MAAIEVRDMRPEDEYYVGTCTHVGESEEHDASCRRRIAWLKEMHERGLRVKVALLDGEHVGFLYVMPGEICTWGPIGRDLMTFPCLVAQDKAKGKGVGRALIAAAEEETKTQGRKALVTVGYYHDFWFMPAPYFEKIGFTVAKRRDKAAILWKVFDKSAHLPDFLNRKYEFKPTEGKVVVDLFWDPFCMTSDIESERVREIAAELGDKVLLNEYRADDREALLCHETARGIFVNGKEIFWGYEAPREGIRDAISEALERR